MKLIWVRYIVWNLRGGVLFGDGIVVQVVLVPVDVSVSVLCLCLLVSVFPFVHNDSGDKSSSFVAKFFINVLSHWASRFKVDSRAGSVLALIRCISLGSSAFLRLRRWCTSWKPPAIVFVGLESSLCLRNSFM